MGLHRPPIGEWIDDWCQDDGPRITVTGIDIHPAPVPAMHPVVGFHPKGTDPWECRACGAITQKKTLTCPVCDITVIARGQG